MLRKHSRQEMAKASLWMHKRELEKLAELSGDMSLNVFLMQIIRKSLANELTGVVILSELEKNKKAGVRGQVLEAKPTTTSTLFVNSPTAIGESTDER